MKARDLWHSMGHSEQTHRTIYTGYVARQAIGSIGNIGQARAPDSQNHIGGRDGQHDP